MLQAAIIPLSQPSLRERKRSDRNISRGKNDSMGDSYDSDDDAGGGKVRTKSRRELPAGAVSTLKAWLLSPEHFTHPYPTPQDQAMLMQKTGIDKKQLKNWFTNARRRIWKPMLKKQLESGQLTAGGAGVPGLMLSAMPGAANNAMDNPHSVQAIRAHYQQAVQQQQQETKQAVPVDSFGNPMYTASGTQTSAMQAVDSLGSLPSQSSGAHLSKTDSHAVLMELFARDQDLVRQATESARLKAEAKQQQTQPQQIAGPAPQQPTNQHPMKVPSATIPNVPTMNSWPHFSSITSLNNLGTIPGVKSITSLSGADLVSKGNVNKMGNLAQVKSMESMGKNDSYAFLEVFFGDKAGSVGNLSAFGSSSQLLRGGKGGEEDDEEIGLSLEDESPSQLTTKIPGPTHPSTSMASMTQEGSSDSGTLKRAYDDALAARGLMSVSRSSEKLTDLVLPAKIQRTLSQEFLNREQMNKKPLSYTFASAPASSSQYPGEQPGELATTDFGSSDETGGHVQVPSTTKCALCHQTCVDTQLRPCGHMFHERCLKPSLQTPRGPPKCPIDDTPMHSAVLAVPTDEQPKPETSSDSWGYVNAQSLPAMEK